MVYNVYNRLAFSWVLLALVFLFISASSIMAHMAADYKDPGPPPGPRVVFLHVDWTEKAHYCCSGSACKMHHITYDYVYREDYK